MRYILLILLLSQTIAYGQRPQRSKVYAGGTNGIVSMLQQQNSDAFRGKGGGLFLHNSGWGSLNATQQKQLLNTFKNCPIAIEIGYDKKGNNDHWVHALKHNYIMKGMNPHFVTVNVFIDKHVPTSNEWRIHHQNLKKVVPENTLILPTFEYANFGVYRKSLMRNRLSVSAEFQKIVKLSRGIVIDVPPGNFLSREPTYKAWVIDALRYSKKHHLHSVVIISPYYSGAKLKTHTSQFLTILKRSNALPSTYVVENYINTPNYPNKIGNEDDPSTVLGIAKLIINSPSSK